MKETPDIDVTVLASGDEPFSLGEPSMGLVTEAVANTVFVLTGRGCGDCLYPSSHITL